MTTEKEIAADEPPPGEAFVVMRFNAPVVPRSAVVRSVLTAVLLMYVRGCEAPLTVSVAAGTKPVPVSVTVVGPIPTRAMAGDSDTMVGTGLVMVIVLVAVEEPLLVVPFSTVIANCVPEVTMAAGICAVSCVALTYVVLTFAPLT